MPEPLPVVDAPVAVPPLRDGVLDEDSAVHLAVRLKPLADPAPLRLLSLLLTHGWTGTGRLAGHVGLGDATVSHHLGVLRRAGLVECERHRGGGVPGARPDALVAGARGIDVS